jgi:putative endonuclease
MALHNEFGKEAEELAVNYLVANGYQILHRNWRYSYFEIDIVAKKNDLLRIIEVKALRSSTVTFPEQAVTRKKFRNLMRAADEYLFQNQEYRHVQFDVLSIIARSETDSDYFLIEDVFV